MVLRFRNLKRHNYRVERMRNSTAMGLALMYPVGEKGLQSLSSFKIILFESTDAIMLENYSFVKNEHINSNKYRKKIKIKMQI